MYMYSSMSVDSGLHQRGALDDHTWRSFHVTPLKDLYSCPSLKLPCSGGYNKVKPGPKGIQNFHAQLSLAWNFKCSYM